MTITVLTEAAPARREWRSRAGSTSSRVPSEAGGVGPATVKTGWLSSSRIIRAFHGHISETLRYMEIKHAQRVRKFHIVQSFRARAPGIKAAYVANPDIR